MGGGPKYSRFATMDRPKPYDYRKRVVDDTLDTRKIDREKGECPRCKFKAAYKFFRCPQCGSVVEEPKPTTEQQNPQ